MVSENVRTQPGSLRHFSFRCASRGQGLGWVRQFGNQRPDDHQIDQIEADADQERRRVGAGLIEQKTADPAAQPHGHGAKQKDNAGPPARLGGG